MCCTVSYILRYVNDPSCVNEQITLQDYLFPISIVPTSSIQAHLTMSYLTFVLLHGAWHTPKCWAPLVSSLSAATCESITPAMPSSGSTPPTPDFSADVTIIRNTVLDLVDQGREVVVVLHSFSGITGGTALEGLDIASRAAKGLKGGVVRLIYVAAFLVPEGFQHSKPDTWENRIEEMKVDFEV